MCLISEIINYDPNLFVNILNFFLGIATLYIAIVKINETNDLFRAGNRLNIINKIILFMKEDIDKLHKNQYLIANNHYDFIGQYVSMLTNINSKLSEEFVIIYKIGLRNELDGLNELIRNISSNLNDINNETFIKAINDYYPLLNHLYRKLQEYYYNHT